MDNTLYVSTSRQLDLVDKLAVSSNNMANLNTTGFKRRYVTFEEFLGKAGGKDNISFSDIRNSHHDDSVGGFHKTGATFDLALTSKKAYFGVFGFGENLYTRNGTFAVNQDGFLVDSNGFHVLSDDGGNISIPIEAVDIDVKKDGSIVSNNAVIAKVGIFNLPENDKIENVGDSFVKYSKPPRSFESDVLSGFLEDSNVESVRELSSIMIDQRKVEEMASFSSLVHGLQASSVSSLLVKE